MSSKIEDYTPLEDCEAAALVGRDGSIDQEIDRPELLYSLG